MSQEKRTRTRAEQLPDRITANSAAPAKSGRPEHKKKADGGRVFRNGMFANLLTAIALAAAIVLGLAVDAVPDKYTQFDLSDSGVYTLSDTTKKILDGLTQDVTIYYLGQTGSEDQVLTRLLDRYEQASSHVKWEQKDPALNPTFASQYEADSATEGSLIVVSGDNSNLVDYNDLYPADYTNYYTTGSAEYSFDGENALTTAIFNVTSGESSKAYYVTNHGETDLSSSLTSAIEAQNISLSAASMLTDGIPADCSLLIINCPTKDFTGTDTATNEAGLLEEYLAGGGKVILTTNANYATPNLDAVMAEFGLSRTTGVVLAKKEDSQHYLPLKYSQYLGQGMPATACLLPTLNTASDSGITDGLGSSVQTLLPMAQGITIADTLPDQVSAQALLTTSESAYSKASYTADNNYQITTLDKESADAAGPFTLAAYAANDSTGAKVVWIGCGSFTNDTVDSIAGGGNSQFLLACAAALTDQGSDTLVEAKALESSSITVNAANVIGLGTIFLLIVPAALVIAGIVVAILRRRK